MQMFKTTFGHVVVVQRFINAQVTTAASQLSRERRGLWLGMTDAPDRKFVVHCTAMPARRGHRVTVLTIEDWVVGLVNATTGDAVNYVRECPPSLLRFVDVGVMLSLLLISIAGLLAWGSPVLLFAVPAAVLYLPLAGLIRAAARRRLQRLIDEALEEIHRIDKQAYPNGCP
ncbi:hypothetical protein [Piscinibacter sp.]|jgi:hypothetical protein|uniref:hypothetical protein n=1 Tax=Piscinibacter sp. TaxID=1903157 RepID=UPI00355A3FAD